MRAARWKTCSCRARRAARSARSRSAATRPSAAAPGRARWLRCNWHRSRARNGACSRRRSSAGMAEAAPCRMPAWRPAAAVRCARTRTGRAAASTCARRRLPLTLALPYLPERSDKRPWMLRGDIALDAQLRPVGNSWRGSAHVTSASGGMKFSERSRTEIIRYGGLDLTASFDPQRLDGRAAQHAQRRRPRRGAHRHRLGCLRAAGRRSCGQHRRD